MNRYITIPLYHVFHILFSHLPKTQVRQSGASADDVWAYRPCSDKDVDGATCQCLLIATSRRHFPKHML
jgi:hypothetical protein